MNPCRMAWASKDGKVRNSRLSFEPLSGISIGFHIENVVRNQHHQLVGMLYARATNRIFKVTLCTRHEILHRHPELFTRMSLRCAIRPRRIDPLLTDEYR